MSKQPWFWHLWAGGRILIPPSTHSTRFPSPDPCVWSRFTLFWTTRPHLHIFHRVLHFHVFQPKILLILLAGGRSKIYNQNYFRIPLSGSNTKFPIKHPSTSPRYGLFQNFPETAHVSNLSHTQLQPKQNYITIIQLQTVCKITPKEHPSTHPTYYP